MRSAIWLDDEPINQPWGPTTVVQEPIYQGHHWHCGFDIGSPACKGKPIFAARAGVVTTYTLGILGITTPSGETDFYVHGEYSVSWKSNVAKGQRIGVISNIVPRGGASLGPHLHFEVQPPGGWINVPPGLNPIPVLQGDDMDARQNALLIGIASQLSDISETVGPPAIPTKLDAILLAVKALPSAAGGAVAPDLTTLKADVATIKATLAKIETALKGA